MSFPRPCSNSINDLAATITIAKEGYPTMAVAGAYAGPMFNVLAGELLVIELLCSSSLEGKQLCIFCVFCAC